MLLIKGQGVITIRQLDTVEGWDVIGRFRDNMECLSHICIHEGQQVVGLTNCVVQLSPHTPALLYASSAI